MDSLELKAFALARFTVMKDHYIAEMRQGLYGMEKFCKPKTFLWITVSPKPNISLDAFIAKMDDKMLSKKWVASATYSYAYEQREDASYYDGRTTLSSNTMGFHFHMCVQTKKGKFEAEREIATTFKDFLPWVKNKSPYVRKLPMTAWDDKLKYCSGKKKPAKIPHALGDIPMRKLLSLQSIYHSNDDAGDSDSDTEEIATPNYDRNTGLFKPKKLLLLKKKC